MGRSQSHCVDSTDKAEFTNPDWMASISDEKSIAEISLPGTHNTMSFYGGPAVQCQSWSLKQQLEAGVRFLDIRARHYTNDLPIHHEYYYQHATFRNVLQETMDFLKRHPREVMIMRLREEYTSKRNTETMHDTVTRYLQLFAQRDRVWQGHRVPTVGEARGKLIILQNFNGKRLGIPYRAKDIMSISDDYHIPTVFNIPTKWDGVQKHLKAAIDGDKQKIYLTYTSGSGGLFPITITSHINPRLYDFLDKMNGQKQRLGIITMDFPSAQVINMIIGFN
uniref:1-phosphatidylinositol phosphodiesterase-like n=1 Tax=Myxine glutinosa TaxID=7769 RepID=UPI00358DECE8